MKPILVSRSFIVESTKGDMACTSNTFILKFADGSEKFINQKQAVDIRLLRPFELEATISNPHVEYCDKESCRLYHQDYSDYPTFSSKN
jgi:hypothetical protein